MTNAPTASYPQPPVPVKAPGVYRVIHTADWHLGKTLADLERTEEHAGFLGWLLNLISTTQTDALIIAGDVFDSATPPQTASRLYFEFLAALHKTTECEVVIVGGNHDSPAGLEAPSAILRAVNAQVIPALPQEEAVTVIPLPSSIAHGATEGEKASPPSVVIAAVPYLRERDLRTGRMGQSANEIQAELREGIRARYAQAAESTAKWREQGCAVLATGHLTVVGGATSSSERDIHIGGLGAVGREVFPPEFSYVALGHLHRPQAIGKQAQIRYSGSPIALSFGEATDLKEIRVLDFHGGALVYNEGIPIPVMRPLVHIRTPLAALESKLSKLNEALASAAVALPESRLEAWVEVAVEDSSGGESLTKAVAEAAAGKSFRILRVLSEGTGTANALQLSEAAEEADVTTLLADAEAVFKLRLEQEKALEESLAEQLKIAFRQVHTLVREAEE